MKNTLCRITGILALAFLAITQVALAQEPVVASIPFQFTAGQTTLPAGDYRVQKVRDGSSVLMIRNTEGNGAIMVMTLPASVNAPQTQSKLIFRRYGDRYFLAQVWSAGSARGRELPKSAKEKEQALAARNETPDQVTIVARLMASDH
jgi:bifunctional DNA-binding transcriptional regulator/antitoxin component of YhaV-PrlF toxin-antitoxin module